MSLSLARLECVAGGSQQRNFCSITYCCKIYEAPYISVFLFWFYKYLHVGCSMHIQYCHVVFLFNFFISFKFEVGIRSNFSFKKWNQITSRLLIWQMCWPCMAYTTKMHYDIRLLMKTLSALNSPISVGEKVAFK